MHVPCAHLYTERIQTHSHTNLDVTLTNMIIVAITDHYKISFKKLTISKPIRHKREFHLMDTSFATVIF